MADRASHHSGGTESTLLDGTRLAKDHPVFEALGAVDELSAALGVVRAELGACAREVEAGQIREVQRVLVRLGAQIASPAGSVGPGPGERVTEADCAALELLERELEGRAPRVEGFVLPGATVLEARVHVARASARSAERRLVSCARALSSPFDLGCRYLNRLSGYLYWLALCHGVERQD